MSGIKFSELKNLEIEFKKIDKLWEEDVARSKVQLEECWEKLGKNRNVNMKEAEEHASKNGNLLKYLLERIFPSAEGGFYVVQNDQVVLKGRDSWQMIANKIGCKSKTMLKRVTEDITTLYSADVSMSEYAVDHEKKLVNLALPMNFTPTETPKVNISAKTKDNVKKLKNFMKDIICSGNKNQWEVIRYIIGCMVQRKKSHMILFLKGLGGIGKTFFSDIIAALLGRAFCSPTDDVITGEDKFNSMMVGASCVLIEETDGLGKGTKLMKALKRLSTSKTMTSRKMFKEGEEITNVMNFVVLSNFLDIDVGDRRINMPDISISRMNDIKYFADLDKCQTKEALQELFNYFYEVDTSKRMEPVSNETKENFKLGNLRLSVKFVLNHYMVENQHETLLLKMSEAYREYEAYAKRKNDKIIVTAATFFDDIKSYVKETDKKRHKTKLYDFSIGSLKQTFIENIKLMTAEKYEEMLFEHNEKQKQIKANDEEDFAVFEEKSHYEQWQAEKLKTEKLEKLVAELEAKLADLQKTQNEPTNQKMVPYDVFKKAQKYV